MKILSWVSLGWLLFACPVFGQAAKADGMETEYGTWGTLHLDAFSHDGKWTAFRMVYESGSDTLFLLNTQTKQKIAIPKGTQPRFTRNHYFVCEARDSVVSVCLSDGSTRRYPGRGVVVSAQGNYLLSLGTGKAAQLELRSTSGGLLANIPQVTAFQLSPDGKNVLYGGTSADSCFAGILDIKRGFARTIARHEGSFEHFIWSENSKAVSFLGRSGRGDAVFQYRLKQGRLNQRTIADSLLLVHNGFFTHSISEDGQKVFFHLRRRTLKIPTSIAVENWRGHDPWTYNRESRSDGWKNYPKMSGWIPKRDTLLTIGTNHLPHARVVKGGRYVLLSDPKAYEPSYLQYPARDYHVMDLETGSIRQAICELAGATEWIHETPDGKQLVYYKDGWKIVSLDTGLERILADPSLAEWTGNLTDFANMNRFFGFGGFSTDGKRAYLYDRFDVWMVALDTPQPIRLTGGKEKGIRFRIAENRNEDMEMRRGPKEHLLLQAYREVDGSSGYFQWKDGRLQPLLFEDAAIDNLLATNDKMVYRIQNYSKFPEIGFGKGKNSSTLYRSNISKKDLDLGFSKMLSYHSQGREAAAAIFYPPGYHKEKRYPVVVKIYKGMSRELHQFKNLSYRNPDGINIRNLTCRGYVVVLPDLVYQANEPGSSSSRSLKDLVAVLIASGIADARRIGLTGYSFGGFETLYAMTDSEVFATGVAGSGLSDILFTYFSMSNYTQRDELWRLEDLQWHMDMPFHVNPDAYIRNNPLPNIHKVKKPVLLYAGKMDDNVLPQQSMAYHLGLRRMGIPTNLLLYPDEGHAFVNVSNQKDLTKKIQEWFDHYLKGLPAQSWMDR